MIVSVAYVSDARTFKSKSVISPCREEVRAVKLELRRQRGIILRNMK